MLRRQIQFQKNGFPQDIFCVLSQMFNLVMQGNILFTNWAPALGTLGKELWSRLADMMLALYADFVNIFDYGTLQPEAKLGFQINIAIRS